MKKKTKLLGSAATIQGAERLLTQYFYGSKFEMKIIEPNLWEIFNFKGNPTGIIIKQKKNRFRIEEF